VARGIPGAEPPVDRQLRAEGQIEALPQVAPHGVEVAVDALEDRLEARERGVEGRALRQELVVDEGAERRRIAVLDPPGPLDLAHAPRDACLLARAVLGDEGGRGLGRGRGERVGLGGHPRRQRDDAGEHHDPHESAIHVASIRGQG
jgi:hypothetical protein